MTSRRCNGRRFQRRRKLDRWSVSRRARSWGHGAFGVGGGSVGGGSSLSTGMLSWRACTFGMGEGVGGSKERRLRVAKGTCTSGEVEVPRRSPGSRSVEPERGMVW